MSDSPDRYFCYDQLCLASGAWGALHTLVFTFLDLTISRVLPADTTPQTVHLLGSWDNFRTASAMEQDIRVGRGVWKYMITDNGGLEMGTEHTYYVRTLTGKGFDLPT